jgi:hypothetical protein
VGFPVLVETTENRIDDPVDAFDVGEDDYGPGAPTDFDEAALDNVGGTQLSPQVRRKRKEVQQFRQVLLQLPDRGRIAGSPVEAKSLEGTPRPSGIVGQVDLLRLGFDLGFIPPSHLFQDISHQRWCRARV